jgi:phage host-nuclease inhibitor protein Gam
MTGEEMERAIEFLLKNQAHFDVRLNRLTEEVGHLTGEVRETGRQLRLHADTQSEFIKVVTQHIEAQAQINDNFRATQTRIAEDLHVLATTVQRFVEGRDSSG